MGNILQGASACVSDTTGMTYPGMHLLFSGYTPLGSHVSSSKSESWGVTIAGVLQNKSLTDALHGLLWGGNQGKKYFGMGPYLSLLGTVIIYCMNCVVVAV